MKIVIALPFSPYPVERGTGRLIMNLIRGLSARHRVTLVTMTLSEEGGRRLREIETGSVTVRSILAPNRRTAIARAWYRMKYVSMRAFRSIPMETSYSSPRRFLELVADVVKEEKADLVLANYWHLYSLPDFLGDTPSALITHDIDYLIDRLPRGKGAGPGLKAGRRSPAEAIEKKAYRRYRTILTVTGSDAEALAADLPGKRGSIRALPLAIDLDRFNPSRRSPREDLVLFTGTFTSDFNDDALRFFLFDVLPRLVEARPGVTVRVAGGGVSPDIIAMAPSNVEFAGYVVDLADEMEKCSVMVLPLRFAGGVRIRMIEAAAMGVPVVSTAVGVAGMGLTGGQEFLLAEDAAGFAESTARLLEDRVLAEKTGGRARQWAERNYSMLDYPDRLDGVIIPILEKMRG